MSAAKVKTSVGAVPPEVLALLDEHAQAVAAAVATREPTALLDGVEAARERLRDGTSGLLTEPQLERMLAASDSVLRAYNAAAMPGASTAAQFGRAGLEVGCILDAIIELTGPPPDDALLEARRRLAEAEAAQQRRISELSAAVEAGDVEAVLTLRGAAEVTGPHERAKGRLDVAETTAAHAARLLEPARTVAARYATRRDEAVARMVDLRAQLERAEAEQSRAHELAGLADNAVSRHEHVAKAAEADADRIRADVAADHANRLRRLAGLPDEAPPPAQQPEPSRGSMVSNPLVRGGFTQDQNYQPPPVTRQLQPAGGPVGHIAGLAKNAGIWNGRGDGQPL